jgi:hypothetical protein
MQLLHHPDSWPGLHISSGAGDTVCAAKTGPLRALQIAQVNSFVEWMMERSSLALVVPGCNRWFAKMALRRGDSSRGGLSLV